jgi:ATP-dependent DNA helicase RecQ
MIFLLEPYLKQFFGFNEFRPHQKEIIENILLKKDTLAILPTGSGKSLCYQLPALIMPGTAIIISPLISLMQDQVNSLTKNGIKAAFINSSLNNREIDSILNDLENYKLIYIAPERFSVDSFLGYLKAADISFFVIDEAHCISSWGHAFRPDYRNFSILKDHFPQIPVAAFTATATPEVEKDICTQLHMKSQAVIKSSFDRPNLTLRINERVNEKNQILEFLNLHKDESGIIYTSTRKSVENTYEFLKSKGFSIEKYHAGLSNQDRQEAQNRFINDETKIIVATIAFGMGINKPNVRFILHLNMPKNIEQYYQEIGRAGRDGLPAECLMLFSGQEQMLYIRLMDDIQHSSIRENMIEKIRKIYNICSSLNCRRIDILEYFGEQFNQKSCSNCDICLDEVEKIDGTVIAQKILSCIYRLKNYFGINHIIDVLRGSKNQNVISRNHHELSTYGIMQEYSKTQIREFINALLNMKYLALDSGEFPTISLTPLSTEILNEKKEIFFRKRKIKVKKERQEVNSTLFGILKNIRREMAISEKVPPYIIFSDKTLIEMCQCLPTTSEAMLQINGVGEKKLNTYVPQFMSAIIKYTKENIKPLTLQKTN